MLDTLAERERLTALAHAGGWVALVVVSALFLWSLSELAWQFLPAEPIDERRDRASDRPRVSAGASSSVALEDLDLFGQAGAVATPMALSAPETTLDLQLQGTLASEDPKSGLAIIIDGENREAYYGVDDDVPGSARVHEIYSDRVILVRQGRYETLSLRDDKGQLVNRPRRGVAGAQASRNAARDAPRDPRTVLPGIRGNQVDLQAVQQQYRIDPAELAKKISVTPMVENGKPIGVRLQTGRDAAVRQFMSRAGLRPSDIITSVNGIPLDDPARTLDAVNQLRSQTSFTVEVRRGDRTETLNIDLNQ